MDVRQAYNTWAEQYDSNKNKTRDLEATALGEMLDKVSLDSCLEIGCGTGKNTAWLATRAKEVLAVDLSEEMLAQAKKKINAPNVAFQQADINQPWRFAKCQYDLICFSLVLEHIEDLDAIFQKASRLLAPNGYIYIGELHPFKQYSGTKARFETAEGTQVVTCFNHHLSDFTQSAKKNGLEVERINEYFDDDDKKLTPRILAILFRKK